MRTWKASQDTSAVAPRACRPAASPRGTPAPTSPAAPTPSAERGRLVHEQERAEHAASAGQRPAAGSSRRWRPIRGTGTAQVSFRRLLALPAWRPMPAQRAPSRHRSISARTFPRISPMLPRSWSPSHRELRRSAVSSQVLLEVGPVGQDEAEASTRSASRSGKRRQEAVSRRTSAASRAGVVVAELSSRPRSAPRSRASALLAGDRACQPAPVEPDHCGLGGRRTQAATRRWLGPAVASGVGPVAAAATETGDGGHHDEDGADARRGGCRLCGVLRSVLIATPAGRSHGSRRGRSRSCRRAATSRRGSGRSSAATGADPCPTVHEPAAGPRPGRRQTSAAASPLPDVSAPSG